ncbi:MAG: LamG-like jellyroll fold domain-containing protein [Planctomycetia bacterium]|nr:LamG-like jellyroll fold domain-containing protein [Planctomycetia bacterium]
MVNESLILVERFLRGELTDAESDTLLALLEKDEQTRQFLRRNLAVDFLLYKNAKNLTSQQKQADEEPGWDELVRLQNAERPIPVIVAEYRAKQAEERRQNRLTRRALRFAKKCVWPDRWDWEESIAPVVTLLVTLTLGVMGLVFLLGHSDSIPITTMARVNETIDAVWEEGATAYQRGQLIDESFFQLKSGTIQLEMNNGVTVILEGPAELTVNNPLSVFCKSGKISANVSARGKGFAIDTPYGKVIDLGTEFFLDVSKMDSQVQVVKGKVHYLTPEHELIALHKNDVLKYNLEDKVQRPTAPVRGYISRERFETRVREQAVEQLAVRSDTLTEIRTMPELLLHFDMNDRRVRNIRNESEIAGDLQPSRIRGKRTEGALFDTYAVSFQEKRDGLTLHVPDSFDSLTIEAVVQVNLQEKRTHVLCSCNDLVDQPGTFLWQFTREGALQLQYTPATGDGLLNYTTVPCLTKEMNGTWVHLRIVMDAEKQRIVQFVNGRPVREATSYKVWSTWREETKPVVGDFVIGNYCGRVQSGANRTLSFPLSEFRLYNKAIYPEKTELNE